MKKYLYLFAAVLAVIGCEKGPKPETADPAISVSKENIENVPWKGETYSVNVTANCSWNVSKTDSEDTAVAWVKCDRATGNGNQTLGIRVEKNPYGKARSATVTVFSDDVKAFINITQAANPDPDSTPDPDPQPEYFTLSFDFDQSLDGWPTSKDDDWSLLKDCDSGCATDNGGVENPENTHRRVKVPYTLGGVVYDFIFADPNAAVKHNIYHDTEKGVYSGSLRYFGLPAISGKKLVKVEMVQNASTKTQENFYRNVGVSKWVYHKDSDIDKIAYVDGGEPLNQNINGQTYTYELFNTVPNTVYWINSPTNASIIKSLKLYYLDADGSEPAPEEEPQIDPEPQDPVDPDPETPVEPDMTLTFDFTGAPQAGWPTAKGYEHVDGGIECTYVLNGASYIFKPADCGTAKSGAAFWQPPVEAAEGVDAKPGYFAFNAEKRYLGLPAIEGYALCRVICHNVELSTTAPKMGIVNAITPDTSHPADSYYVKGGSLQTWDAAGGQSYTYNLSGTEAETMYYIYAYTKGAVDTITLGYVSK